MLNLYDRRQLILIKQYLATGAEKFSILILSTLPQYLHVNLQKQATHSIQYGVQKMH